MEPIEHFTELEIALSNAHQDTPEHRELAQKIANLFEELGYYEDYCPHCLKTDSRLFECHGIAGSISTCSICKNTHVVPHEYTGADYE